MSGSNRREVWCTNRRAVPQAWRNGPSGRQHDDLEVMYPCEHDVVSIFRATFEPASGGNLYQIARNGWYRGRARATVATIDSRVAQ